ncbi:C1 family peptidase [Olsenella phocaeensis]|uniref:aminopeptidase C n=1 Tax=Olsenella phocaeensis TaxID=1852385 RepID=UPI00093094BD|nr:C1 family peptidase [Olsenella phocaeensis]
MSEKTIGRDWAARQNEEFCSSRANRIGRNAVTATDVMQAARDTSVMRGYHDTYGVRVPKTADITNQRQSGRCWMFTAYNVARHATMDFLDVDSFEFSQAYGMFYDKLEKANAMLENVIATAGLPADSREVQLVLEDGMGDGGYYHFAMNLIAKWGVVPKDAMPETACSKSSAQMDAQLERLLHRDAGILRRAHAEGKGEDELRALKEDMLSGVYRMLAICLGEPPARFDFVCTVGKRHKADASKVKAIEPQKDEEPKDAGEKDGPKEQKLVLRDPDITPLEFAERYLPFDPHDYVSLVSMPGKTRPYGHAYHLTLTDSVVGGDPHHVLNVEPELLDQVAVNSLKAGVPVSMACDVMQEFPRHVDDFKYVLSTDGMDLEGLFDVELGMGRDEMIDMCETGLTHAMTFQGVELDEDDKPKAWRIENSWGKEQGKDGYLIMTADWFHTYGGEVDVRREFVPDELLKMWDETPVEDVAPWSGITSGFARRLH